MTGQTPGTLRVRMIKLAAFAVVIVFVGRAFARQFTRIDWAQVHFSVSYVAAALLAYILARIVMSAALRTVLAGFGQRLPLSLAMAAPWLMQIGKYVPGKVASLATAIVLLGRGGVPAALVVVSLVVFSGMGILAGLLVSSPLTLWQPVRAVLPGAWVWFGLLMTAGIICLSPRVFAALAAPVLRRLKQAPLPRVMPLRAAMVTTALLIAQQLLNGVAFCLVVRSVAPLSMWSLAPAVAIVSFADTLGFLAFFAPGGVGVREGALLAVAAPIVGGPIAAISAVVSRLAQMLVEALMACVALVVLRVARGEEAGVCPAGHA